MIPELEPADGVTLTVGHEFMHFPQNDAFYFSPVCWPSGLSSIMEAPFSGSGAIDVYI